jgi:hypothetical protein
VAHACYVRVEQRQARTLATMLYTSDWQLAAVEQYAF